MLVQIDHAARKLTRRCGRGLLGIGL